VRARSRWLKADADQIHAAPEQNRSAGDPVNSPSDLGAEATG
jgi:hypothetical protein